MNYNQFLDVQLFLFFCKDQKTLRLENFVKLTDGSNVTILLLVTWFRVSGKHLRTKLLVFSIFGFLPITSLMKMQF